MIKVLFRFNQYVKVYSLKNNNKKILKAFHIPKGIVPELSLIGKSFVLVLHI